MRSSQLIRNVSVISTLICFLLFVFSSRNLIAASLPLPAELTKIAFDFSKLEESYREGEWGEADKLVDDITKLYAKVLPNMYKAAKGTPKQKSISQFSFLVKNLKKNIAAKNRKKTGKTFELLEVMVIDFIELFKYDKHPYLAAADDELEEMIEEVEYDEILEEVEELQIVIKRMEPTLKSKGITDAKMSSFYQRLEQLEAAAKKENKDETIKHLTALKELNEEFLAAK